MNLLKKGKQYIAAAAGTMTLFALEAKTSIISVFADNDNTSDVINKITSGDNGLGLFDDVEETAIGVGNDLYGLLTVCALIVSVGCFAGAGICMAITKNSGKREENKNWIFWIFIALGVVFMAGFFVTTFVGIAQGVK